MNSLNDYAMDIICKKIKMERAALDRIFYRDSVHFAFVSYSITALKDLLSTIMGRWEESPLTVVEEYRTRMDTYACDDYMFSVAYDVATDILDELIKEVGR